MKTKREFSRYSSRTIFGLIIAFILSVSAFGAISYPKPTPYKYLNDYAEIVDRQSAQQIIALGQELEQKTGAQAIIITLNSLDNRPIEEYANGLFRKWGIGQNEKDNGLLILLAVQEQRWRVEVGRGLEGAIPDALSNRIMQKLARPEFEAGYYGQGLAQAYSQFSDQIATEYGVTLAHSLRTSLPIQEQEVPNSSHGQGMMGYGIILAILFIDLIFNRGQMLRFLFLSSLFSGNRNNRRGGGGFGGFGGGSSNGGGSSGGW